jgi:hypothetical protein
MRTSALVVAAAAVAAVLTVVSSCGDDGGAGPEATAPSTTARASSSTTSSTGGDGSSSAIDGRVYFVAGEAIATAGRALEGPGVGRRALEALLDGPVGVEAEIGQVSEIPAGTELLGLDIAEGRATVDLSGDFEAGGGSLSMRLRAAQVVFTLTQFETVDTVSFMIDGRPVETIGGEGVAVDDVDRTDFAAVTPFILVESPVPGQAISSPVEITGMANTFEATVQYLVTDGEGLIVDEGFTTATAGNGVFGTFSVTSSFAVGRPGVGAVVAFEDSARDGQPINVYEVPVDIG